MAVLAYRGVATLWEVYLMSVIVAAGFWMFWPTINALIQELTPDSQFVHSNSFLLAGVQGGWLVAGAVVGFVYNKIGLHGVLFIDFASYVLSFICYLFVRKGKHTVAMAEETMVHDSAVAKFVHELKEGIAYIKLRPRLLLLGIAWALFIGGMLTQGVITAPFSDRILKSGAVGYGWLNAGWAIGAFMSAIYTPALIRGTGHRRAIGISMALLGISLISLPFLGSHIHGCARCLRVAHGGPGISCMRGGLLPHGLLSRAGRRGHYQHHDGTGAKAFHGTRAEYFLFFGNADATGILFYRWHGLPYSGFGARVRDCRRNLSAGMPHRFMAGKRCGGGAKRQAGTRDVIDLASEWCRIISSSGQRTRTSVAAKPHSRRIG